MYPGNQLKQLRIRLGMSTRAVAGFSRTIASIEGNPEYLVSSPWLTQIENNKSSLPSIYKLFTLSSVYGLPYARILGMYGVDVSKAMSLHGQIPVENTHLTETEEIGAPDAVQFPIPFDLDLNKTAILSQMIGRWGTVPFDFLRHLNQRRRMYGFVGLGDYTLHPLLRPGSFVEIDPESKKIPRRLGNSEFDRPIYFIDLRDAYACAWCEVTDGKLVLVPHPLSPAHVRTFDPNDAEIIGQVIGIAMYLDRT